MSDNKLNNFTNKCISILERNDTNIAIEKIAQLKYYNKTVGYKDALKIFKLYSKNTIKYQMNKYENNIDLYRNKVNRNIQKCGEYCSSR
jgi:hypothetical protein